MNKNYNDYCSKYKMNDYPYISLLSEYKPEVIFEKLKQYIPIIIKSNTKYYITGFNEKNTKYLPPIYGVNKRNNNNQYVYVMSDKYMKIDIITDWFTEPIRIRSKKKYNKYSIYDTWKNMEISKHFIDKLEYMNKDEIIKISQDIFHGPIKSVTTFRPTWIKGIYKILELKLLTNSTRIHVLDASMGWGDRLITTIAMNWDYTGYDPNINLESAYKKIIKLFGNESRHKYIIESFETQDIKEETYDIAFTSPPFYDLEIYDENPETNKGQSIVKYLTFEDWKVNFLIKSVKKMWNGIKPGGILSIHIRDYDKNNMVLSMLDTLDEYNNSIYLGVIGIKGGDIYTACWCWRKSVKK